MFICTQPDFESWMPGLAEGGGPTVPWTCLLHEQVELCNSLEWAEWSCNPVQIQHPWPPPCVETCLPPNRWRRLPPFKRSKNGLVGSKDEIGKLLAGALYKSRNPTPE